MYIKVANGGGKVKNKSNVINLIRHKKEVGERKVIIINKETPVSRGALFPFCEKVLTGFPKKII